MGLVLIFWVGRKVNGLDLGSRFGPNILGWAYGKWVGPRKWVLVLIGWVGPKVNGLDLGSGLGPNRLGWT